MHVQVDLDEGAGGDPPAHLGVARRVVPAGEQATVDRFELGRDGGPVAPLPRRLDQLVGAGEVALQQLARGRRGDGAGVEAAEEDLDQRPRDLGREHPLLRFVESGDVERVGVAQRRRGDARRERLVDVDDVGWIGAEQALGRVAGEDPPHLVAAPLQLLGHPRDELVDPVGGAPPVGRDLDYRERLHRHRASMSQPAACALLTGRRRLAARARR